MPWYLRNKFVPGDRVVHGTSDVFHCEGISTDYVIEHFKWIPMYPGPLESGNFGSSFMDLPVPELIQRMEDQTIQIEYYGQWKRAVVETVFNDKICVRLVHPNEAVRIGLDLRNHFHRQRLRIVSKRDQSRKNFNLHDLVLYNRYNEVPGVILGCGSISALPTEEKKATCMIRASPWQGTTLRSDNINIDPKTMIFMQDWVEETLKKYSSVNTEWVPLYQIGDKVSTLPKPEFITLPTEKTWNEMKCQGVVVAAKDGKYTLSIPRDQAVREGFYEESLQPYIRTRLGEAPRNKLYSNIMVNYEDTGEWVPAQIILPLYLEQFNGVLVNFIINGKKLTESRKIDFTETIQIVSPASSATSDSRVPVNL